MLGGAVTEKARLTQYVRRGWCEKDLFTENARRDWYKKAPLTQCIWEGLTRINSFH